MGEPQLPLEVGLVRSNQLTLHLCMMSWGCLFCPHTPQLPPCIPVYPPGRKNSKTQFAETRAGARSAKPSVLTVPRVPWLCARDGLFRVREGCHLVEGPSVAGQLLPPRTQTRRELWQMQREIETGLQVPEHFSSATEGSMWKSRQRVMWI